MKKRLLLIIVLGMLLITFSSAYAGNGSSDAHKIANKWRLSGTFDASPGYNWAGMAEGATWKYKINIKEAMDGDNSVGVLKFKTGEIKVVGQVKATKRDYKYWSGDNLAAVGTTTFNGSNYYFMFLYAERATWLALSTTPYQSYWDAGTVWPSSLRTYQLHSLNTYDFPFEYKVIHE